MEGASRRTSTSSRHVRAERAAWTYLEPTAGFETIRAAVAFYCRPMDACLVDGERAEPEANPYYGGWVTADILV